MNSPAVAQLDQMELDLKRLRQDAEHFSASIKQLEIQSTEGVSAQQMSYAPWFFGGQGLVLGAGLLLIGALWGWRWIAVRKHNRPHDFGESGLYRTPLAPQGAGANKAETPGELHGAPWSEASDWGTPVSAQEPVAPIARDGFDFEAAASEVERVRKSLAQKRAQREKLRHAPPSPPPPAYSFLPQNTDDAPLAQNTLSPTPVQVTSAILMDSELEFDLDIAQEPKELTIEEACTVQVDPPAVGTEQLEQATEAVNDALAVKLALAQEFFALGLNMPARELAHEVIEAGNQTMAEMAHEVLSGCDVQERATQQQQQDYAVLVESLRGTDTSSAP